MTDEHDNLKDCISSIPDENGNYVVPTDPAFQDLYKLRRERDAANIRVEELTRALNKAKSEATACFEIRKSLVAEIADIDKALKDALKLIVYLASRE